MSCREAPLRHFLPYQAFHAATDFPEHNNKSRGGRSSRSPMVHGLWITGHDPTIQQPHGPIGHHSLTVPRSKDPSPILPHKLRHKPKPKPDLTHQPGLPGTKNISQKQKATQLGGFQVSMVSEAGFEPARPVCGH